MATQRNKLASANSTPTKSQDDLLKVVKRKFAAKPVTVKFGFAPGFRDITWNEVQEITTTRISSKKFELQPTLTELKKDEDTVEMEFDLAWEIALRSRTISDMFILLGKKRVQATSDLEALIASLELQNFLPTSFRAEVSAESTASKIFHEGGIEETVAKVIKRLKFPDDATLGKKKTFRFFVEIHRDVCRVWLALSHEPLWKKGYKASLEHTAPLREDLAACAIRQSLQGVDLAKTNFTDIIVPFAGTGTLGFETERFLERKAGETHAHALTETVREGFFVPRGFEARFANLCKKIAKDMVTESKLKFQFCDTSKDARATLAKNVVSFFKQQARAEFSISTEDCLEWKPQFKSAFVPMNPPYGDRLKGKGLNYETLGKWIVSLKEKGHVNGFCLCGDEDQSKAFLLGLQSKKKEAKSKAKIFHFTQGGLHIRMVCF